MQCYHFNKAMRTMNPSDFEGWHLAPGINVEFLKRKTVQEGVVSQLLSKQAEIIVGGGQPVKMDYDKIRAVEPVDTDMTWQQAERFFEEHFNKWRGKIGLSKVDNYFFQVHFGQKSPLGVCSYMPSFISIAVPVIQLLPSSEVKETILHEIAHALAGYKAGHGIQWKVIAKAIGSTGSRLAEMSVSDVARTKVTDKGISPEFAKYVKALQPLVNTLQMLYESSFGEVMKKKGFTAVGYKSLDLVEVLESYKRGEKGSVRLEDVSKVIVTLYDLVDDATMRKIDGENYARITNKRGKELLMIDVYEKLDRQYGTYRKAVTGQKRIRYY